MRTPFEAAVCFAGALITAVILHKFLHTPVLPVAAAGFLIGLVAGGR